MHDIVREDEATGEKIPGSKGAAGLPNSTGKSSTSMASMNRRWTEKSPACRKVTPPQARVRNQLGASRGEGNNPKTHWKSLNISAEAPEDCGALCLLVDLKISNFAAQDNCAVKLCPLARVFCRKTLDKTVQEEFVPRYSLNGLHDELANRNVAKV